MSVSQANIGKPFTDHDKLRELILHNAHLLPVLTRFGIALGFGESTVNDVCHRDKVDTATFLVVCNFFSSRPADYNNVDLPQLIQYLKNAHRYFLEYVLPGIRARLISAISPGIPGDFAWLLIKFYDEYVDEVRKHMDYEEEKVFEYVLALCDGIRCSNFTIEEFKENHLPIAYKLKDIKELFIGHYKAERGRVDLLNSVLFDLINCECDLMLHCALEDKIFVPAVQKLEKKIIPPEKINSFPECDSEAHSSELDAQGDIVLTARERDIVRAIAQGLSNKEIADKLFLSVHTVTTHRRNISSKLNIHSPSGLTIYALMHGIITLEEGSALIK